MVVSTCHLRLPVSSIHGCQKGVLLIYIDYIAEQIIFFALSFGLFIEKSYFQMSKSSLDESSFDFTHKSFSQKKKQR